MADDEGSELEIKEIVDRIKETGILIVEAQRYVEVLGNHRRAGLHRLVTLGLTQREIAKLTGMSQPRVCQVLGITEPVTARMEEVRS